MEKRKLEYFKFVSHVIDWLREPRNQSVIEYHESCMQTMSLRKFRAEIKAFLKQRLLQGEGLREEDVPRGYLGRATSLYIEDVLC